MVAIKNKIKQKVCLAFLLLCAALFLSACGESPDVDSMTSGLVKSGIASDQAACFAASMEKTIKGEPYNYMASLMNKGETEKNAVNKTRRKHGADFKDAMGEARKACVK